VTRPAVLLLSLAAVLSALLALQLLPGPEPDEPLPTLPAPAAADPAAAGALPAGQDDADAGLAVLVRTVLARPLFSQNRRPVASAGGSGATAIDSLPRLAGVIVAPGGNRAIFAPAESRPLVLAEGGHIGRYVVRAIAPGQVTLSDAEGQLVIRPSYAKGTMP
jgi:hypothetical protein